MFQSSVASFPQFNVELWSAERKKLSTPQSSAPKFAMLKAKSLQPPKSQSLVLSFGTPKAKSFYSPQFDVELGRVESSKRISNGFPHKYFFKIFFIFEISSTNNAWTSCFAKDLQNFISNVHIVDTFARYLVTVANNCVWRIPLLWFNGE